MTMMIESAFFDIDGVLTDGAVYIQENGTETKRITFDDIDAIFELKRAGIRIGFITGEQNLFTDYLRKRFEPDFFIGGCKDKLNAFQDLAIQEKMDEHNTCFVGDSRKDIPLLSFMHNYSFVPMDVDEIVKKAARFVVPASRGNGVIRKVADIIHQINQGLSGKETPESSWIKAITDHQVMIHLIRQDQSLCLALQSAASMISEAFRSGGRLFICGCGESAYDLLHIASETADRLHSGEKHLSNACTASAVTLVQDITCSDCTDDVVVHQIEENGKAGDVLLLGQYRTGKAEKYLEAFTCAKEKGIKTIVLTGNSISSSTSNVSDVCIRIPSTSEPRVRECYVLLTHVMCEMTEKILTVKEA